MRPEEARTAFYAQLEADEATVEETWRETFGAPRRSGPTPPRRGVSQPRPSRLLQRAERALILLLVLLAGILAWSQCSRALESDRAAIERIYREDWK